MNDSILNALYLIKNKLKLFSFGVNTTKKTQIHRFIKENLYVIGTLYYLHSFL